LMNSRAPLVRDHFKPVTLGRVEEREQL